MRCFGAREQWMERHPLFCVHFLFERSSLAEERSLCCRRNHICGCLALHVACVATGWICNFSCLGYLLVLSLDGSVILAVLVKIYLLKQRVFIDINWWWWWWWCLSTAPLRVSMTEHCKSFFKLIISPSFVYLPSKIKV